MKYSILSMLVLISLIATIPLVPRIYAQNGPIIDILRQKVVQSPDQALLQMRTHLVDMSPDLIRVNDVEILAGDGNLITQDLGFHMGFIGYNSRDLATIQATWRAEVTYWPQHDVEFRHALIHCYDQLGIIPPIYGYTVTPVRSLVPPAESKYYEPNAQAHPYNPGNPFTSPSGEHSTCGILKAAGYTFVDAGTIGVVDDADYWNMPNGAGPMIHMQIWTPLIGVAPTSYQHGAEFVTDLAGVGLAGTTANGQKGYTHLGRDFNEYLNEVYGTSTSPGGRFDAFMVFYSLGRVPDHLFSMCHTTQDVAVEGQWGRRNSVGMNDATVDELTAIVKYSNDPDEIEAAAKEIQVMLYNPDEPNADYFALSYMILYSRSYFNAWDVNLGGVVKSPGYGSDNGGSFLNAYWIRNARMDGTKTVLVYVNGDYPDSFNPNYATTVYEWNILEKTEDALTDVNPYNHYDTASLATEWSIVEVGAGMDLYFTLRSDVKWQDGYTFTASDVEFCLEFMRDHHVPRYAETWATLTDVEVVDATHLIIHSNAQGVGLFYDYAGIAALLPPQIWDRDWAAEYPGTPVDQAVLDYDPTVPYDPAYAPGPTPTPTNLFGTGPWIFEFYDADGGYDDLWRNPNYWMSQADIATMYANMFWEVADGNKDGIVDVEDYSQVNFRYGSFVGDPNYLPEWNFNSDDIIDGVDYSNCGYHVDWKKFRDAANP